jgi:hypothetical protein
MPSDCEKHRRSYVDLSFYLVLLILQQGNPLRSKVFHVSSCLKFLKSLKEYKAHYLKTITLVNTSLVVQRYGVEV